MLGWVLLLAMLGGLVGVGLNHGILTVNAFRKRIVGAAPHKRRLACLGGIELVILATLSSSASVLLPEALPCQPLTIGQLEYGFDGRSHVGPGPHRCAPRYGKCGGGANYSGPVCCPDEYRCVRKGIDFAQCVPLWVDVPLDRACMPVQVASRIPWSNPPDNTTCAAACLRAPLPASAVPAVARSRCNDTAYSAVASLVLAPSESAVRALYMRGVPFALEPRALLLALAAWTTLTILTAGVPMPLGLMIPMIVIGGCLGRLFGLLLHFGLGLTSAEPAIFALVGSTSVLAGSGQIRLFLATVMLEITDQLRLAPFVVLAAMVATFTAECLSPHGLYHALNFRGS